MAILRVTDFIDINTKGWPTACSWQVALDPEFNMIIEESLEDYDNVLIWHAKLPMIDNPDEYYADLDKLYARVKVHIDNTVSPWYVIQYENQNQQPIIVTELDGSISVYDSIIDNFN